MLSSYRINEHRKLYLYEKCLRCCFCCCLHVHLTLFGVCFVAERKTCGRKQNNHPPSCSGSVSISLNTQNARKIKNRLSLYQMFIDRQGVRKCTLLSRDKIGLREILVGFFFFVCSNIYICVVSFCVFDRN